MNIEKAKELFFRYSGNKFFMNNDGVLELYRQCNVSIEIEKEWLFKMESECYDELIKEINNQSFVDLFIRYVDMIQKDKKSEDKIICLLEKKLHSFDANTTLTCISIFTSQNAFANKKVIDWSITQLKNVLCKEKIVCDDCKISGKRSGYLSDNIERINRKINYLMNL